MALGFFSRLKEGLSRSTQKLSESIGSVLHRRKLDEAALADLEDGLVAADLGTDVAARIIEQFRRTRFGTEVSDAEIRSALAGEIAAILRPVALPLVIDRRQHRVQRLRRHVVLLPRHVAPARRHAGRLGQRREVGVLAHVRVCRKATVDAAGRHPCRTASASPSWLS